MTTSGSHGGQALNEASMINDVEKRHIKRSWKLVIPIADTAADLFYKRLFELEPRHRELFPANMAKQKVFAAACAELPPGWLFDACIARTPWFLRATHEGVPLGFVDSETPPAVAWLFDHLAAEVAARLELTSGHSTSKRRLL
jgi:hypothetical protein